MNPWSEHAINFEAVQALLTCHGSGIQWFAGAGFPDALTHVAGGAAGAVFALGLIEAAGQQPALQQVRQPFGALSSGSPSQQARAE